MIIFDIEASGVDPINHGILSIGAVDFNDPTREFFEECKLREDAHVSDEALVINGYTQEQIHDDKKQSEQQLVERFIAWAMQSSDHTLAGQVPQFDINFIQFACKRYGIEFPFAHRSLDQHSICYAHMMQRGITPPLEKGRTALNSDTIMNYVGIPAEPKPHIAINGAKYETEAFSRLLHNKHFFEEFAQYPIPWQE